jgi:hypothetical protein
LLGYGVAMLINLIGALSILGAGDAVGSPGMTIALSVVWFIVVYPLSYECVYFTFYNSLITGKAVKYICSMVMLGIWWGFLVFVLIGIAGGVGLIAMINCYSKGHPGQGTISLFFCLAGAADAAGLVWAFFQMMKFYKAEGLRGRALAEVSHFAAERAYENRDVLAQAARDNPELTTSLATSAASSAYG